MIIDQSQQKMTRSQARVSGAITDMPDKLALPSRAPYEKALTIIENPSAFLLQILPQLLPELHFTDGTLYFRNTPASKANLVKFRDSRPETIKSLDVPMLNALYSILLAETKKAITTPDSLIAMADDQAFLDRSVTLYMPEFFRMMGHAHPSQDVANAVFAKLMNYERTFGAIVVQNQNQRMS